MAIDLSSLASVDGVWRSGLPVNIDIVATEAAVLLERWVLCYEQPQQRPMPSQPSAQSSTAHSLHTTHSLGQGHHQSQTLHDAARPADSTELILLVHSLYSHVRQLPLGLALLDGSASNASLADGRQIAPLDNSGNLLGVACSGFHPTADLKVHRFRSAHTSIGTLHLSVVLDQACLMRFALAASLLRNIPALDAPERKGPLCIAQSDAALISDSCPESEMQHKLPKQPLSAQPSQQPQSAQAQTGLADASTIRRTSSGSPFPSPKMQKRALFLANLKLDHPDPSLSGSRTPHTGSCTPMASSSASIASTPRFHSPLAHKRSVTLLPRSLAIPDSADLDSSNLQTSLVTPPMPQSSTVPAFRSSLREHMMRSSSSSSEEGDDLSVLPPRPPSITPLRTSSHASNRDSKSRNAAAACAGGVMTASHTDAVDDYNLSDIGSRHSLRRVSTSITSSITHDKHSAAVTPVASRRVSMPAMSSKLSGDSVFFSPLSPFARGALSPTPSPQAELNNPLVGSYEESILSGRMSTFSSKPISFLAEIGVIAFGKCKSSLKCPPHLIVAFPAYFFELRDDDLPVTPYVGSIESSSRSKKSTTDHNGYRLPPRGQIQIVIKNPSRTAIKVFLIQYDLRDMPANTKTFLRQKSYALSTVPSPTKGAGSPSHSHRRTESSPTASSPRRQQVGVDDYLATSPHLPSLSSNISSDSAGDDTAATILPIPVSAPQTRRPSQSPSGSTAQRIQLACDRLRYAIHLQFICTAKRHLYLSKSIRVVFSHRAPDADEKLRTVCEGPTNPKYLPLEACTPALQPSAVVLAPDASGTSSASGTVFSRQYPSEPQSSILDQPANQQIGQQTNEAASESATARDALLEIAATKAFQRTRTVSGFTIRSTSPEPPSSHSILRRYYLSLRYRE
eukprot:jgi/Hompol1/5015/HPOL_004090-RA